MSQSINKKTITISSLIPKALVIGLFLGLITVFIVEHFGKFSFMETNINVPSYGSQKPSFTRNISMEAPIHEIYLKTPFGKKYTFSGAGYKVFDMYSQYQGFGKYSTKVTYFIKATFNDYIFILIIGLGYASIFLVFTKFRFRFS